MATQDQLDALHRVTGISASDTTYTDELLSALIDLQGSVSGAAAAIWREKAATFAGMVDTTESGSSRKLSQLSDNALKMAAGLDASDGVSSSGRSFTVGVERQ
jgi:hypothetical protein